MTTMNNTATSLVGKEGTIGYRPQLIVDTDGTVPAGVAQLKVQPTSTEVIPPTIAATEIPMVDTSLTLVLPTNTLAPTSDTIVTDVLSSTPIAPTPTPNGPTLTIEMNTANVIVDSTVSAAFKLNNMSNLYGLQTECKVDPAVLSGTGHLEGNIFTSSNSFMVDIGYQNDGKWSVADSLLNPAPAFNGDGTAFSLNYKVINVGYTTIECSALAVDSSGNLLPIAVVNGNFDSTQVVAVTNNSPIVPMASAPALLTVLPIATLTPTLEPTLPTVPSVISGSVKYEKSTDQTGISITVLQNGTAVIQGQSDADGNFQFNDVPTGQYIVQFSAQGYLSTSSNIDVLEGQGATVQATLIAGDIDNNGVVDLADASFIGANYDIQAPPAPVQSDLDHDGFINLVDLVLLGKNFGKTAQ
jgi:hypothetical protein